MRLPVRQYGMTSLATSTDKTMPRKFNYPGYQTGGPTPSRDVSADKARYYDELMRMDRRAYGGIIGLQTGGPAPQQTDVTSFGVPQQTAHQWASSMVDKE